MNAQDRALVQELATGLLRDIKYRPEQKSKLGHHEVKELSLRLRDYEEALYRPPNGKPRSARRGTGRPWVMRDDPRNPENRTHPRAREQ